MRAANTGQTSRPGIRRKVRSGKKEKGEVGEEDEGHVVEDHQGRYSPLEALEGKVSSRLFALLL
jgi:hypothetical protein